MKISESTLSTLKNFASINPSLIVRKGRTLKTISPVKTVFAVATLDEEFPSDFAIYDLNRFIGSLSLFGDPSMKFDSNHLTISEGKQKMRVTYADPSMIVAPPEKEIELKSVDCTFTIEAASLQRVIRSLGVLGLQEVAIVGEDGLVYVRAVNTKTESSDSFSVEVGTSDKNFSAIFKSDNLKLMTKDYTVKLSFAGIAEFKADNVTYYVPCEASSKF